MRTLNKIDAIYSLAPNASFSLDGDNIIWISPLIAPVTEQEIETELARLQAEQEANQYKQQRAAEYPSYADQFDTIFHQGLDAWKAQIQAVKTKYPKS